MYVLHDDLTSEPILVLKHNQTRYLVFLLFYASRLFCLARFLNYPINLLHMDKSHP